MVVHLPDPHDPLRLAGCQCVHCGYELKGVRDYRCPECGNEIDVGQARYGPKVEMSNLRVGEWIICWLLTILFALLGMICFQWQSSGVIGCMFFGFSIFSFLLPLLLDWLLE